MIRFREEKKHEVLLAINASILQHFCGDGFYFYEVLATPVEMEERIEPILQQQKLADSENADSPLKPLWLSLCMRLTRNQNEFNSKNKIYYQILILAWLCLLALFWAILASLMMDTVVDETMSFLLSPGFHVRFVCLLLVFVPLWIPVVQPLKEVIYFLKMITTHFSTTYDAKLNDEYYQSIQGIVDDFADKFSEIGLNLDYVEDHRPFKPSLVYIRMTISEKQLKKEEIESPSLSKRLERYQEEAREDSADSVAEKLQQEGKKQSGQFLFGIPLKKVEPWGPVILCLSIPLAFLWVVNQLGLFDSQTVRVSAPIHLGGTVAYNTMNIAKDAADD